MQFGKGMAAAAAVATCLMLAGCGEGGGVNSTPAPAPAPTPTPTAGANSDLLGPLKSESFVNDARQASLTVNGGMTTSSGAVSGTFVYDASTQTYTMTVGSHTQSFRPGDIDRSQSNAAETVYVRTLGDTTDSLTVTAPGTGGRFTYKYVGAAFWQMATVNSSAGTGSGTIYSMTYGEATPTTGVPKTGQGSYSIDVIGAETVGTDVRGFTGQGTLLVDFSRAALLASGSTSENGLAGNFQGSGKLSASGSFSGTFSFSASSLQVGSMSGRLYGPNGEELGGTFSTTSATTGGPVGTGAIIGRSAAGGPPPVTDLGATSGAGFLAAEHAHQSGSGAPALSTATVGLIAGNADFVSFSDANLLVTTNLPPSLLTSSSNFTSLYLSQATTGTSATRALDLLDGGRYSRTALWYDRSGTTNAYDFFNFGVDTPASALPKSGYAGYFVNFGGVVQKAGNADYALAGAGTLGIDFASGQITTNGTLQLANSGSSGSWGGWSGTGTLASSSNAFTSNLSITGATSFSATAQGRLFGPAADELGAVFGGSSSDGSTIAGELAGPAGANLIDPSATLATLTGATTFTPGEAIYADVPGISPPHQVTVQSGLTTIVYDAVAKTYTISNPASGYNPGFLTPVSATLTQADIDAAHSDATFTAYAKSGVTMRVLNPGAGNPAIKLTYTSFADIIQTAPNGALNTSYPVDHYLVFGLHTNGYAVPVSGSASYSGVVYGRGAYGNVPGGFSVGGTGQLTADFGAAKINASLDLNATPVAGGATEALGSFAFTGSIASYNFYASGANGGMNGTFFGPHAEEVGAAFDINDLSNAATPHGSLAVAGVFVGKKN